MTSTTYKDAGVDIEAGHELVRRIGPLAKKTLRPEVVGNLGGFAGLCAIPEGYTNPLLVAGTDGVGTKLKVAFMLDRHDTVGIDLVAMCVNDIICCGAEPLFFLDYFATGALSPQQGEDVVRGIAEGCSQAGCALLGGETAELPGFYARGEYDLAGFCVGVVERDAVIDGSATRPGDVLLGLASSGLHSNGYSLARKVLLEGDNSSDLLDELLTPTRIYARAIRAAQDAGGVHAIAHITGGGLAENLLRVVPQSCTADIRKGSWRTPDIFATIAERGQVSADEMSRTFNMGIGMVVVVAAESQESVTQALKSQGETVWPIGHIVEGDHTVNFVGDSL